MLAESDRFDLRMLVLFLTDFNSSARSYELSDVNPVETGKTSYREDDTL